MIAGAPQPCGEQESIFYLCQLVTFLLNGCFEVSGATWLSGLSLTYYHNQYTLPSPHLSATLDSRYVQDRCVGYTFAVTESVTKQAVTRLPPDV